MYNFSLTGNTITTVKWKLDKIFIDQILHYLTHFINKWFKIKTTILSVRL